MTTMEIISSGVQLIGSVDWAAVSALILVVVMATLMVRINAAKSSTFFFDDMFLDDNGKASTSKLSNLIALVLSSWAFVHLTLKGTLTESYFTAYMLAWVANRGVTNWLEIKAKSYNTQTPQYILNQQKDYNQYDSPDDNDINK